jgi:polysaccharide biosynthesis/export protein
MILFTKDVKRDVCFVGGLLIILFSSSCSHTKNIAYFRDLSDTVKVYSQVINETYEMKIQSDDIVQILVNSINPEATAVFNAGNTTSAPISGARSTQAVTSVNVSPTVWGTPTGSNSGYLVDRGGNIDFPVLGSLHVEGMTTKQLKDLLKLKLDKYLREPIVNVRVMNSKITVLGEVAHPATYSIQNERITVIDAIGMAGDLTIYGKRENVLLIREENGERKFVRLNLNSSSLFQSPYYYLKQNDAIYIEPNKNKVKASDLDNVRRLGIITTVITTLVVLASRLIR